MRLDGWSAVTAMPLLQSPCHGWPWLYHRRWPTESSATRRGCPGDRGLGEAGCSDWVGGTLGLSPSAEAGAHLSFRLDGSN